MPFGRRNKAAQKRRLLAAKCPKRLRPRFSGNWNPMSEETISLLNEIHRPANLIDRDLSMVKRECAQLSEMKSRLETLLNKLRAENLNLQAENNYQKNEESEENDDSEC